MLVASGLESALPDPEGRAGMLTALVARSIVEGVLEALVGLLLVELCYRLILLRLRGRFSRRLPSSLGALVPRSLAPQSSRRRAPSARARASRPQPPVPGRAGDAARC